LTYGSVSGRLLAEEHTFISHDYQNQSIAQCYRRGYALTERHVFWSDLPSRNVPVNALYSKAEDLGPLRHVDAAATTTKNESSTDHHQSAQKRQRSSKAQLPWKRASLLSTSETLPVFTSHGLPHRVSLTNPHREIFRDIIQEQGKKINKR
jgi:hypothetical protein